MARRPRRLLGLLLTVAAICAAGWAGWRTRAEWEPPARVPAAPPVSLLWTHPDAALTRFGMLPDLLPGVLAQQWSSVDPAERNQDGAPGNILYKSDGRSVVFAATGAGIVDDIWVAGDLTAMGRIQIVVDGRSAVNLPAAVFFSGRHSPFLAPLAGDAAVSSGGNYSYVPIGFRHSCEIAFTGTTAYWHVAWHPVAAADVTPFRASADLRTAAEAWRRGAGAAVPTSGIHVASGTVALPAHGAATLARFAGPGRIVALKLVVPAAAVTPPPPLTASGITFGGTATFTVRLPPGNRGVRLVRRLDFGLGGQRGEVSVDGVPAAAFAEPGQAVGPYRWADAVTSVPAALTAGREAVRVSFACATECSMYGVTAYAVSGGRHTLADALAMTPASEAAHGFVVSDLLASATVTSAYPPAALAASQSVLDALWIRARFDGERAPTVLAPAGLFFGSGFGAWRVSSLMMDVAPATGTLSAYWPMPAAHSADVALENRGPVPIRVRYTVRFRPQASDGAAIAAGREGYFHATYLQADPTSPGETYTILDAPGTGKLVGVALAMTSPPGMPYGLDNLQGNAQIYVDGDPSPVYLGTGTEDFFQGGWYFEHGVFSLPTHGSPAQWVGPGAVADISAYRLFVADAIPFANGIHADIQVGPLDNLSADYASVALWYGLPRASLEQTDLLLPADPASARAHRLRMSDGGAVGSVSGVFPGRFNGRVVTQAGVAAAQSTFTVSVPPTNRGVVLWGIFDQCLGGQSATVWVDGHRAGVWVDPGADCSEVWREGAFQLPERWTAARATLQIRLVATRRPGDSSARWTSFGYRVDAYT